MTKLVRYCDTPLTRFMPCGMAWVAYSKGKYESCYEDGKCSNMVPDGIQHCPYCGHVLEREVNDD